jgi:hypothetical protein
MNGIFLLCMGSFVVISLIMVFLANLIRDLRELE